MIYEHRPDFQLEISDFLQQLIQENQENNIEKDTCTKKEIRFAPKEWDDLAFQKSCQKWTSSQRILLFQFWNTAQYLGLGLVIGPGDEKLKQEIHNAIKDLDVSGIKKKSKLNATGWSEIFAIQILGVPDYEDGDLEAVKNKIEIFFEKFLTTDIQLIREAINTANLTEGV